MGGYMILQKNSANIILQLGVWGGFPNFYCFLSQVEQKTRRGKSSYGIQ